MTDSPRILVVDDDEVDRAVVRRALRSAGVDAVVHEADAAVTALSLLESEQFDCVFLDYNLPGRNGLQVLRDIRSAGIDVPVVALTGHGDEQVAVDLLKAGAVDYLAKSLATPERLTQSLRHAIRVHDAEKAAALATLRLSVLAEASAAFASSLDSRATVESISRLTVRALSDYCLVYLLSDAGVLERASVAHRQPELESKLADASAEYAPDLSHEVSIVARAMRTGEPQWLDTVSNEFIATAGPGLVVDRVLSLGLRSIIVVPLTARDHRLGVLVCIAAELPFSADDFAFAQDLGFRAALALDSAFLYEEARRAVKARDEVLAVVSHDLRNPLNVIFSAASLLIELQLPAEQQLRHLQSVQRGAERMNRLIQDLLDVTQLEAGGLAIIPTAVPPHFLVDESQELLRPLADNKNIAISFTLDTAVPTLVLDRDRMLQVLGNLVGNALKFTPPGGRIDVTVTVRDGEALFSVADTGPGIPQDDIKFLFDRFWQARRSGLARGEGIGLGLAIAKGVVESHGGRIWAESSLGQGSVFYFTVPLPVPVTVPTNLAI